MKNKRLTVVIGLFVTFLVTSSQTMAALGVKGGVMMSKMDMGSESTTGSWMLLGWRAGAFYSFSLSKTISLEPGITFAMERSKYYEVPGRQFQRVSISFIKTPILLGFHFPRNLGKMFIGPYFVYRLGKEKHSNPLWQPFNAEDKLGFGLSLGFRFYLPIAFHGSLRSFIEIHLDQGFTRFKRTEVQPIEDPLPGTYYLKGAYYKSQNISFMVGFTF
ncbi:MAG: outer membrane beta-barrel protein [Candidatus Aminicenantes bacterium]|nr:MAG: outer membrane beta-barrel protein [Candidatus Aminicenantes bacterium]